MEKHTRVYLKFFGYGMDSFIRCEVAWYERKWERAVDIHHINGRGKGKDVIENLMGVSRVNHDRCAGDRKPKISKEQQAIIHKTFIDQFKKYGYVKDRD